MEFFFAANIYISNQVFRFVLLDLFFICFIDSYFKEVQAQLAYYKWKSDLMNSNDRTNANLSQDPMDRDPGDQRLQYKTNVFFSFQISWITCISSPNVQANRALNLICYIMQMPYMNCYINCYIESLFHAYKNDVEILPYWTNCALEFCTTQKVMLCISDWFEDIKKRSDLISEDLQKKRTDII